MFSRAASQNALDSSYAETSLLFYRSVMSAGDILCSKGGAAAHISVTTAQGQVRKILELQRKCLKPGQQKSKSSLNVSKYLLSRNHLTLHGKSCIFSLRDVHTSSVIGCGLHPNFRI